MGDTVDIVRRIVLNLVPMVLSLSVHEFAHALAADRLGDDTPRRQGRLTLSPLAHYDLFGTFLVPVVAAISPIGFALIGWAKPVQFVPARLTRKVSMKTGTIIVAMAGPLSNLALAILSIATLATVVRVAPELAGSRGTAGALVYLLRVTFLLNVGLFIFNLLPLPPLDGSRLLPRSMDELQATVAPYSFLILLLLLNVPVARDVLFMGPLSIVAGGLETLFSTQVLGFSR